MLTKIAIVALLLISITATTLFSVSPTFTVTYEKHFDELAHAYYDQKLNQHGMNYIYVYANSAKSLLDQHRGTGFLQGYTTYRDIYAAYNNFNKHKINGASVKQPLQDHLNSQIDFIQKMAEEFDRDLYWQTVYAYLEQCRYAHRGYLQKIHEQSRLDMYIGFSQFYYLTNLGDFKQLLPAFNGDSLDIKDRNGNVYVKKLGDQLFSTHQSFNYYPYLLKMMKSYNFPTRNTNIGSSTITFSSGPGDFSSNDDFYILSSGLKIMETSFLNFDTNNFADINSKSVPGWIRTAVASNLAKTGNEWIDYYMKYNSGTHNCQWVIVDQAQLQTNKNVVIFLEQAFSLFKISDMTDKLLKNGFVASYNVPFNSQIINKLDYQRYPFTFNTDPRASIFKNYNQKMNNQNDMKLWLLTNQEDDSKQGIAPREQLSNQNPIPHGLIDCKIIGPNTENQNYFWAIVGPTTSNGRFPIFDWSKYSNLPHQGMANTFNFTWQKVSIDFEKSQISSKHITTE